jgi:hypothetical protein
MTQDPGTVAEEAAKLLEALGAWARGAAGGSGSGSARAGWSPEDLQGTLGQFAEHAGAAISDGSPACRLCPVCQLIAVLRHARPETFAHLLDASAALTAAARSLLESAEASRSGRPSGVQKIDLDPPGSAAGTA